MDRVDDSDGEMGGVLGRLQEVHLAACEAARPDPVVPCGVGVRNPDSCSDRPGTID